MISHTQAYSRFKEQVTGIMDFAVVTCYAVPSLKIQIKTVEAARAAGKTKLLPAPDFFTRDSSKPSILRNKAADYKSKLSAYLWLSNFSFFEFFVSDVIKEMIDFHGGVEKFVELADTRSKKSLAATHTIKDKRKIQEYPKSKNVQRYQKYSENLNVAGFQFPSALLFFLRCENANTKTEEKNFKSVQIPDVLKNGLHLDISNTEETRFHSIRDTRNKIGHGKGAALNLSKVMKMHEDLHSLAVKIDKHLIEHYFLIEKYS